MKKAKSSTKKEEVLADQIEFKEAKKGFQKIWNIIDPHGKGHEIAIMIQS